MPQLDPTWFASQIFWLAVTFTVLYVLISRVLLPPITGIIATRQSTIDGDIASSEAFKKQAQTAKDTYERALAEARSNSRKIIDEAMEEHKRSAELATIEVQDTITRKLAKAEKSIQEKRDAMLKELTPAADEMAALITKQMTN